MMNVEMFEPSSDDDFWEPSGVPRNVYKVKSWEHSLLGLYENIMASGEDRSDRTGTGTRALFGQTLDVDLTEGFPLATTKKVPFKAVLSELLWFLAGSGDERRLAQIHYGVDGQPSDDMKTIWSANATGTTGAAYVPKFPGDLGRIYGTQWREWRRFSFGKQVNAASTDGTSQYAWKEDTPVDQIADIIHKLKTNPTDRRIILSAHNVGELNQMALPPCHMFAQFYCNNVGDLSCLMYMRSVDTFLGLPFNVASYALLTMMIAQVTGLHAHRLKIVMGDTHIYKNHREQVRTVLRREVRTPPKVVLRAGILDIDDFSMDDFYLQDYDPHPAVPAPMAA